ncbi:hypothetical protein SAMN05660330_02396 [Desulforhopalus singaporensis]|uniref:Enoyl-CoA hydratase n=1 Tax=Desulforhopalus singaporensis TaxID=91360 RepID=A0A1H0RS06_9BACT|nr:hypothetical protein [Desulforhopalus singaporensis]SDP32185.1 hypothetical protein SAMN05660330_02396 [Desulforhopalus singaporensis]
MAHGQATATLSVEDRVATLILRSDDVRNTLTGTALVDDIVKTVRWITIQHPRSRSWS